MRYRLTAIRYLTAIPILLGMALSLALTADAQVPAINGLSPSSKFAGDPGFVLTVVGNNFVATSTIRWNSLPRTTTFVSSTELRADIPATDIASVGAADVTVLNPDPGGGVSNPLTFDILNSTPNPIPDLISISPSANTVGAAPFTLVVTGNNFVSGAVVRWNLSPRATTYVSSTQLRADILASDLALAIPVSVSVTNPAPGGGISGSLPFTLFTVNPVPNISGLNPASVTAGGAAFTLEVNGTNFVSGSVVRWNNSTRTTTFVNNLLVRADIPASDINTTGTATISVFNPTPGGGASNQQILAINSVSPMPTITSLSPSSATAGSGNFQLTVNGTNFITDSKVRWNGLDRATVYVSSSELRATILSSDISAVGTASVTVFNIPPSGGTSNVQPFTINNPLPTITGLNPSTAVVGSPVTVLTVNGGYFVNGSVVRWNGQDLVTTFVNGTQLKATIPSANLTAAGIALLTVVNVPTGGGTSNAEPFTITNPAPKTTDISPTSITAGSSGFTLTVNGSQFISGSVVRWKGQDRATTFVSSSQLKATILSSDLDASGTAAVTVYSPGPGGGLSSAQTFTINNPIPTLTSLSPNSALAGDAGLTLTVTGTNFVMGSKVRWKGVDRTTTYVSTTQLKANIPASDLTVAGTYGVTVFNPAPGGGTTDPKDFTVNTPPTSITSLTPDSVQAGGPAFTLKVNGTNFISSSKVRWNGVDLITKFVSSTELTASVPASNIAQPGTANITVFNPPPGGGSSNAKVFAIGIPIPTLTKLNQNSAIAGASALVLSVSGTNFVTNSKVNWNGSERVTHFTSNSQLTAEILAADLAVGGTANVTVVNPATEPLTSNALTFDIKNPLPTITTVNPSSARAGESSLLLTVMGTNFVATSIVRWNGVDRPTTFVSNTQLKATLTADDLSKPGKVNVTVYNASPGGGNSSAKIFTVGNPLPVITSLSPSSAIMGSGTFTLTVYGNYFLSTSKVRWNGSERVTKFISSTQLTTNILATDIASTGTANITVINLAADGPSNSYSFIITTLQLSSMSLHPSSVKGGQSLTGLVSLNGAALPGGTGVSLSSTNKSIARVPATVTIPAGSSSASFTVTTLSVPTSNSVLLSGSYGGVTRRVMLAVADSSSSDISPSSTLFVPIVLSSAGANNSFYTSELTLTNRGSKNAILDFSYTAALGDGTGVASDVLSAGQQRIYPNAISYLKSIGIPIADSGNRGGTLRIRSWGVASDSDVSATVRTTTAVPNGRAGLSYPAITTMEALTRPVYLFGLRQNATDRSHLALQNVGEEDEGDIALSITIYSGDPSHPFSVTLPDEILPPGGFKQINAILASQGLTNGYIRVERTVGTAPYYAYAIINDQITSDGSFVPPLSEDSLAARQGLIIPVIVETSNFSSEVVLTNFSGITKTVRCTLVADALQPPDHTVRFSVELSPGQQAIYPNFVQKLRESGVTGMGPPGTSTVGALFVTVDRRDVSGIFVGTRTSAPGGGGRYGLFYKAVPYGATASHSAWLYGLQQNFETRSNLALVNTGESDLSSDQFTLEIFDGDTGLKVRKLENLRLSPRQWTQINSLLDQYAPDTTQGYVHITRTSGANPFLAYAVIVDGGEPGARTGDGAFVSMEIDP